MLTKESLASFKEDPLVNQVLLPLMRAMKYQDVTKTHGGVNEQGKDIVCWCEDELGTRKNIAIVAKAVPINAQANYATGTAGEISAQIRQAFGHTFLDPITGEELQVRECWVVTNKTISKDALQSISSMLDSMMSRQLKFIGIDKLWELIELHMPTEAVWQKLQEARNTFAQMDPHYSPQVLIDDKGMSIGVKEKYPGASLESPLNIHASFEFPDQPDALDAKIAMQRHIETGAAVKVENKYIKALQLPNTFKNFLKPVLGEEYTMTLESVPNTLTTPVRIEFRNDASETVTAPYVELRLMMGGTEESTLSNEHQLIPLKFTFILRNKKGEIDITMEYVLEKNPYISQAFSQLQWQACLSKPFIAEVFDVSTGLRIMKMQRPMKFFEAPDPNLLGLVEDLMVLQNRTNKPIRLPSRDFTLEERETLGKICNIVRTGKVRATWDHFNVRLDHEGANKALETYGDGKLGVLRIENPNIETVKIFDSVSELGTTRITFFNAKLSNESEIKEILGKPIDADQEIELRFLPEGQNSAETEYIDWLTGDM